MQKLIRGSGLGHAFLAALWSFPFCRCHFICWVPRFKIALQAYVRFLYCERSHFQICIARLKFLLGCPFILLSIRLVWHISVARHVSPGDDCSLLLCGGDMGWVGGQQTNCPSLWSIVKLDFPVAGNSGDCGTEVFEVLEIELPLFCCFAREREFGLFLARFFG